MRIKQEFVHKSALLSYGYVLMTEGAHYFSSGIVTCKGCCLLYIWYRYDVRAV